MAVSETTLEIDLNALVHNFRFLKSKISPSTRFMAVVKAFAYGSDAGQIALKLQDLGVDYFAVAYSAEGVNLRKAGIKQPILVLYPQPVNFDFLLQHRLMPCLHCDTIFDRFKRFLKDKSVTHYPVHLEVNTGMNRLGFHPNEIPALGEKIQNSPELDIDGFYTHLAASEDPQEKEFSLRQIEIFQAAANALKETLPKDCLLHCCNTSGILNYPRAHFDMVRAGIGLYGFGNAPEFDQHLKPIATLKTHIAQLNTLEPGETVGYNRSFVADKKCNIAVLPLGHADGISRIYGHGKARVEINGKQAPIIGNVCMDMLMIDVTSVDCKVGDEVVLFGKEKTAEDFAKSGGTISYELITSISQRVTRKILGS